MRDVYYGVVLAVSVAAVWGTGAGAGRAVSIAALCTLVPWYCLVGRRARRERPVPARTVCYQLAVLGLLMTAQVSTLTSSLVLFALVPQSFMLLPIGWGMLALALFNVVPVIEAVSAPSLGVVAVAGVVVLSVAFGGQFGWWIQGIIQQSRQRADLITELLRHPGRTGCRAQRRRGLAERSDWPSEIHDTLAQGFTSILMLSRGGRVGLPAAGRGRAAARDLSAGGPGEPDRGACAVAASPPTELAENGLAEALARLAGGSRGHRRAESAVSVRRVCAATPGRTWSCFARRRRR